MSQGYPSAEQVERADVRQLLGWTRGLPSPNDVNRPTLDRILKRLAEEREKDNGAYVAASKSLTRGAFE